MTERLTEYDSHGDVYVKHHDYISASEKLAHYEDLEEQDRLIKLPEGMNLRKLLDVLTEHVIDCPSDYNLLNRCELSCFECWLAALKGEEHEV